MAHGDRQRSAQGHVVVMLGIVAAMVVIVTLVRPTSDEGAHRATPTLDEPPARVSALPAPPFAVAAPEEPPPRSDGRDLKSLPAPLLRMLAHGAAAEGNWNEAVTLQHWAVAGGSPGEYDLACYYGRVGLVDASIYWLQRAAAEEGADADWAGQDQDLEKVRADLRWGRLRTYLIQATQYWIGRAVKDTLVVLPKGYAKDRAIPVIVGLHGMGSRPEDFAGPWAQSVADELGVAFVSVSGTLSLGPHKFRWSESVARDAARIDEALAEARDRLTVADGKIVLIGFSQGAQMSAEVAARQPTRFAGAIVMSPGTRADLALQDLAAAAETAQQRFVVVVGAGEHPGNVTLAKQDAARLSALGADVFHKAYAGVNEHSFPPDFDEALPSWIRFILHTGPKP